MPEPQNSTPGDAAQTGPLIRYLPRHIAVYCAVLAAALIAWFFVPGFTGLFWPMTIWGIALLVHFLIVRSQTIDQDWADERSGRIVENATDLSHIDSIRQQHEERMAHRNTGRKNGDPPAKTGRQ